MPASGHSTGTAATAHSSQTGAGAVGSATNQPTTAATTSSPSSPVGNASSTNHTHNGASNNFSPSPSPLPLGSAIDPQAWLATLLVKLNQVVFSDIGRSLLVRHREVFAFLLATRIQHQAGYISNVEWCTFLSGSILDASSTNSIPPSSIYPSSAPDPDLHLPPVPRELAGFISWSRVGVLDRLLPGLVHSFVSFPTQWLHLIQSSECLSNQTCPTLPDGWDDKVTAFQRLLLSLTTCPHQLMPQVHEFINKQLGVQFTSSSPTTMIGLDRVLMGSGARTPIILVTPQRNDPGAIAALSKFVNEQGKSDKFVSISLDQDVEKFNQPTISTALLSQALTQGHWVFVHHIYRNPSWLVTVEHALENAPSLSLSPSPSPSPPPPPSPSPSPSILPLPSIAASTVTTAAVIPKPSTNQPAHSLHPEFRLWLHCVEGFDTQVPISILQKGVKVAVEEARTVGGVLAQVYSRMDERLVASSVSRRMAPLFRRLVFGLCFFHASVVVRNQYPEHCGGWGGELQFSETDLALGIETIRSKLAEHEERNEDITFSTLQYTIAEVIYGGHVSTTWALNALREMFGDLISPLIGGAQDPRGGCSSQDDRFTIPSLPLAYSSPPDSSFGLDAYLRSLPVYDSSLAVGLDENVSKEFLQQATLNFMADLSTLSLGGRASRPRQALADIICALQKRIPVDLMEADLTTLIPNNHSSLWLVAAQREFDNLSCVLTKVKVDLHLLVSMGATASSRVYLLSSALSSGEVPDAWQRWQSVPVPAIIKAARVPSSPPLAWLTHIVARWAYFRKWLQSCVTPSYISMDLFDAPRAIFSCLIHSYAYKKRVPVESVTLTYHIQASTPLHHIDASTPTHHRQPTTDEHSVLLSGVVLLGATWDETKKELIDGGGGDGPNSTSGAGGGVAIQLLCHATSKATQLPTQPTSAPHHHDHSIYLCPLFQGWSRTSQSLVAHIPIATATPSVSPSPMPSIASPLSLSLSMCMKRCVSMHIVPATPQS